MKTTEHVFEPFETVHVKLPNLEEEILGRVVGVFSDGAGDAWIVDIGTHRDWDWPCVVVPASDIVKIRH